MKLKLNINNVITRALPAQGVLAINLQLVSMFVLQEKVVWLNLSWDVYQIYHKTPRKSAELRTHA